MAYNLRSALSAAALVAGLAASPAFAQIGAPTIAGGAGVGGGAALGGHIGGFSGAHGGAQLVAPNAATLAAPQFHAAPVIVPQAHIPHAATGGAYIAPHMRPGRITGGSPWAGGPIAVVPRHEPRAWRGPGVAQPMHNGWRHHGRGRWRGGVWYPYFVGGYDVYPTYETYADDDSYCVLRKVRVHTPYGWRRVWRRVCA